MARTKRTDTVSTEEKKTNLKPDEFHAWLTLPRAHRVRILTAAASQDMRISELARRAVLEIVRRIEAGKKAFTEEDSWD